MVGSFVAFKVTLRIYQGFLHCYEHPQHNYRLASIYYSLRLKMNIKQQRITHGLELNKTQSL